MKTLSLYTLSLFALVGCGRFNNTGSAVAQVARVSTPSSVSETCVSTNDFGLDWKYSIEVKEVAVKADGSKHETVIMVGIRHAGGLVKALTLENAGIDAVFNGKKVRMLGQAKVNAGKLFLYAAYAADGSLESKITLKHDGVGEFPTNCKL